MNLRIGCEVDLGGSHDDIEGLVWQSIAMLGIHAKALGYSEDIPAMIMEKAGALCKTSFLDHHDTDAPI